MVRSVEKISSASLSMTDTGTPEFVNRIYIPRSVRGKRGREIRAYPPGCVLCIRSHYSPRDEREARQCLAQCGVKPFDIQDLWNYVESRNLLYRTKD